MIPAEKYEIPIKSEIKERIILFSKPVNGRGDFQTIMEKDSALWESLSVSCSGPARYG